MAAPVTPYRGTHRRPLSTPGHVGRATVSLTVLSVLATLFLDVFLVTAALCMLMVGPVVLVVQRWRDRAGRSAGGQRLSAGEPVTTG
ncbi:MULTISPECIES: hypothetical protein [unclassified Micromonospora]|uniref:hypothetical protein n=1 Tax=unclassified Micromonospora TaxID=2617518 RepID=UPI002FF0DBEF